MIEEKYLHPEILLIEDNDDDAEIVESIYKKNKIPHSICRMKNGEDAIEYIFQKGSNPKIVLLDINLPTMNGIEVLRTMRANLSTVNIPVFMFTSSKSDNNINESYRLGVTSYIRKQTTFEKFEEAIIETDLYLKEYKILVIENNSKDAEIIFNELKQSNLRCIYKLATNKEEYKTSLINFKPDIIFCNYEIQPQFDAIQAVHILQKTDLKIPFILVTSTLNDNQASGCMTEGMDDYILKEQFKRFPITLINNLRKKKIEIEKTKAIENLKKSEKELNEMKSRFVSMASHEIRTPLTTILSSLTLIDEYYKKEQEDKRQKHFERIKINVKNITDILNNILAIDKFEKGKMEMITKTSINLEEFSNALLKIVNPILKREQSFKIINSSESEIFQDENILMNIILNLLINAVRYSEENQEIYLKIEVKDNFAYFILKDEGIGIPIEEQKNIFQKFYRASNASNIPGIGLGLNIVEKYTELLNGKINFVSKPELGSTFTVKIPT